LTKLYAILLIILLFIFFGCAQPMHKPSVAEDSATTSTRTNTPDFSKETEEVKTKPQKPSQQYGDDQRHDTNTSHLTKISKEKNHKDTKALQTNLAPSEKSIPENASSGKKTQAILDEALDFNPNNRRP